MNQTRRDARAGIHHPEGAVLVKADILFDPQPMQAVGPDEDLGERRDDEGDCQQRLGEPVLASKVFQRKYQE